jgi:solute carrier family 25 phosphate transporter 3
MSQTDVHDASYYFKCMMGGVLACGLTHTIITPLDIVKCRKQTNPEMYKSLGDGLRVINQTEGFRGLTVGWQPTILGYSAQGFGKFGFYEIFKDVYKKIVGPANSERWRTTGFLISSACAEVIADFLLCPMESLKVRMQTSDKGTFPTNFGAGLAELQKEGLFGFYKGITPLLMRQVPYTMVKFAAFEKTVEFFYKNIFTKGKKNYSKATQLSITFLSGYWAGIFCAIVSHPADTMVSKLNKVKSDEPVLNSIKKIYGDIGFNGLWRGLTTRIIMIGTLTGLQWWIYDSFKTAVGLQTTGGK